MSPKAITKPMCIKEYLAFLGEFAANPAAIGAIAPSSPALAQEITTWIDWPNVQAVLEYGPGTGAFTQAILDRKSPRAKFAAIEASPALAQEFRAAHPGVTLHEDSVANVSEICASENIEQVDAIVSGLPWAAFSDEEQNTYLDAMMEVLPPGGQLATFAYLQGLLLPASQRFKKKLARYFSQVTASKAVWNNFPPAFVYRCRR